MRIWNRSAKLAAVLIQANLITLNVVAVVKPVVGIKPLLAILPMQSAAIIVRAAAGDEFNLNRTVARTFGNGVRTGYRYLIDSVDSRAYKSKKPIRRAKQIILHIDSVDRE